MLARGAADPIRLASVAHVTPLTRGCVDSGAGRWLTARVTHLDVVVDATAAEPPFEQVRAQVEERIRSGALAPGDRLPTVRALAADLGLAANTVARAYKELEAAGLVETRSRAGTVVASGEHAAAAALGVLAARYVAAARGAGITDAAAVEIVRRAQLGGVARGRQPTERVCRLDASGVTGRLGAERARRLDPGRAGRGGRG